MQIAATPLTQVEKEFARYFRCPESFAGFQKRNPASRGAQGFFLFGRDIVCYGSAEVPTAESPDALLSDALPAVRPNSQFWVLPFDPEEIVCNLRQERYVRENRPGVTSRVVRQLYYLLRPALPVGFRRHLQRRSLKGWTKRPFPSWPVDTTVDRLFLKLMELQLESSQEKRIPFIWFWPEGKQSCAIMTHDVETNAGLRFAGELMDVNDAYGVKSSFQLIPDARYQVGHSTIDAFRRRGFEVNVHDLKHDGHLYDDEEQFRIAAKCVSAFGERFGSRGFRSGALYRNQEWYSALRFSYDMSVPNCAHLDPQHGGCCTVMPYFVGDILELPVTATQDYSLFHIIGTYSLDLWREQIQRIMDQHGMISFIVHPDYLDSAEAVASYRSLLSYLTFLRSSAELWIALPGEVDTWWRERDAMQLVPSRDGWKIVGAGAERARLAYASVESGKLVLSMSTQS